MSQKKHKKRHPQAKRRVSAPVEESAFHGVTPWHSLCRSGKMGTNFLEKPEKI